MSIPGHIRPYTMNEQPDSDGRAFLARAFTFLCCAEWGYSAAEIEAALGDCGEGGDADAEDVRETVEMSVRQLGTIFLRGEVDTFARPFGGGAPSRLHKEVWEIDDFRPRFASSAIDPRTPYDPAAPHTHWLFVDAAQFDVVLGRAYGDANLEFTAPAVPRPDAAPNELAPTGIVHERFLRMPEVLTLVGMSRSTLYGRMKAARFPRNIDLGGNIVAWRESEVREWMEGHSAGAGIPASDP